MKEQFLRLEREIDLQDDGSWEHVQWRIIHAVPLTGRWGAYRRLW